MIKVTSGCAIAAVAVQIGWVSAPAGAQVIMLVSEGEVAADRAAPPPALTRGPRPSASNPDAPRIDVLAPEMADRPLVVPFAINLRFVAAPGREIEPASLKILYGRLGLDVTARILAATQVTRQGIDVPSAQVPKGSHRFLLEIRDNASNVGRREFEIQVGD